MDVNHDMSHLAEYVERTGIQTLPNQRARTPERSCHHSRWSPVENRSLSDLLVTLGLLLVIIATACSSVESASIRRSRRAGCVYLNSLITHINIVFADHTAVHTDFKIARFNDITVTSANIDIPYLPSINDITAGPERRARSALELLPEYYQALLRFKSAFQQLTDDEIFLRTRYHDENLLNNFVEEFERIVALLTNCIHGLENYTDVHGIAVNDTINNYPEFDNTAVESVISNRNLLVFEEFNRYFVPLVTEFGHLERETDTHQH